jgi:hypothetical protein
LRGSKNSRVSGRKSRFQSEEKAAHFSMAVFRNLPVKRTVKITHGFTENIKKSPAIRPGFF